jgi:hypothetical protein
MQNNSIKPLETFINRMKKLNIDIGLIGNYPWIYIDSINKNKVKEKYYSDHKYTIGFLPIKQNQVFQFLDIKELFLIIRKYK